MDENLYQGLSWLTILCATYLLPTLVALFRKKQNTVAIAALNFLLGWTFLGWVVALVWALTHEAKADVPRPDGLSSR
jgi:ABC-type transport system involved in cytochrome c biogenesis permease component